MDNETTINKIEKITEISLNKICILRIYCDKLH